MWVMWVWVISAEMWVTWAWLVSAKMWVTWVWLISAEIWVTWVMTHFCRGLSRVIMTHLFLVSYFSWHTVFHLPCFSSGCSLWMSHHSYIFGMFARHLCCAIIGYDFSCFWAMFYVAMFLGDSVCIVFCHVFWAPCIWVWDISLYLFCDCLFLVSDL